MVVNEEIVKNDDYMKWLENHIQNNNMLFNTYELNNTIDQHQASRLPEFFSAIQLYAIRNYLWPVDTTYGSKYYIKYNDITYEVGYITDEKVFYFVKRLPEDEKVVAIDFEKIVEDKLERRTIELDEKFGELSELVKEITSKDVPLEVIVKKLEKKA